MRKLLATLLLALAAAAPAAGQTTKIVTDAVATGQTGAMQTNPSATSVQFEFCGTGFTGPVYVDAGATSGALSQVWTASLTTNSDCTTIASPALAKWYRVRWTRSAGTLNVWSITSRTAATASYATMTAPTGCTAGSVALFLGSPLAMGCDAGITYDAATDTLTIASAGKLNFSTDAGLARSAAGVLKVTDGSNGDGSINASIVTANSSVQSYFGFGNTNIGIFGWSNSGTIGQPIDTFLSRGAPATLQLGAANSGTPVGQSDRAQGGSGTNIAGQRRNRQGSLGTGSADSGAIADQTGYPIGSGSTAHTYSDRRIAFGRWTALTESSATPVATLTYGASTSIGTLLFVTVRAGDGTEQQAMSYFVQANSARKATGNTVTTVGVIGTPPAVATTVGGGTLTCTFDATEGAAAATINANCASSLTQTFLDANVQANSNGAGVTIAQP